MAITAIGLERSNCHGTCPQYQVLFRSDGTARYTGGRFAPRSGEYAATLPSTVFEALATELYANGLFNHQSGGLYVGFPISTLSVWYDDPKPRQFKLYGGFGQFSYPRALAMRIDSLVTTVQWVQANK